MYVLYLRFDPEPCFHCCQPDLACGAAGGGTAAFKLVDVGGAAATGGAGWENVDAGAEL
jgi:hypothetical protein